MLRKTTHRKGAGFMQNESVQERLDTFFEYMAKFSEQHPEIASSFMTLTGNIMQDGALGAKEKELIAVGIATGLNCVSCIYAHTKSALSLGASPEEVLEAAAVAVTMGGGPGMAHVAEVMKALEAFSEKG